MLVRARSWVVTQPDQRRGSMSQRTNRPAPATEADSWELVAVEDLIEREGEQRARAP